MKKYKLDDVAVSDLPLMIWLSGNRQNKGEPLHLHDCIEMMYITKGAGICHVNGKPFPASRGDMFVIPNNSTHDFQVERDLNYFNIMFRQELFSSEEFRTFQQFTHFNNWISVTEDQEKHYQFMPPFCDELEERLRAIADEFRFRANGYELSAKSAFIHVLIFMLRHLDSMTRKKEPSNNDSALARTIHYINKHYKEALTVNELAQKAGVSVSTLSRLFKKGTGDTPVDYIGKIRAGKAQFELEHTDKPISQIALELGYYDSSYFSRAFKRYIGTSPRTFRQQLKKAK